MQRKLLTLVTLGFLIFLIVLFVNKFQGSTRESSSASSPSDTSTPLNNSSLPLSPGTSTASLSQPGNTSALSGVSGTAEGVLEYLKLQHPGDWQLSRDPTGRIFSISGGLALDIGNNSHRALEFAKTIAEKLGHNPGQLNSQEADESNPNISKHHFEQKIEDFIVFQSSFSLISRKKDGAVYIINNELKKVENLSTEISFDIKRAETLAEEHFKNREPQFLECENHTPVIFADSATPELGWRFELELNSPHDKKEVIVGIASGKVIYEKSMIVH
jgi:hypothetical protein